MSLVKPLNKLVSGWNVWSGLTVITHLSLIILRTSSSTCWSPFFTAWHTWWHMELTMHAVDELSMPVDSIIMTRHNPENTKIWTDSLMNLSLQHWRNLTGEPHQGKAVNKHLLPAKFTSGSGDHWLDFDMQSLCKGSQQMVLGYACAVTNHLNHIELSKWKSLE